MFHNVRRAIGEALKVVGVLATSELAGRKILEGFVERTRKTLLEAPPRATLLKVLLTAMPAKNTDNLWRWQEEASKEFRENKLATLLTLFSPDELPVILAALNHLSSYEEFKKKLDWLDHDPIPEKIEQFRAWVQEVRPEWPQVKASLETADQWTADQLLKLAVWLEKKGVR